MGIYLDNRQKNPVCTGWGGGRPGLYELRSNTVGGSKAGGFGYPTIHAKSMVVCISFHCVLCHKLLTAQTQLLFDCALCHN